MASPLLNVTITTPWIPIKPGTPHPTAPTTSPAQQPLVPNYALLITGICCIASIIGCIAIFLTFYRFPEYRSNSRKLLLYLTIADIFTAIGNLAGVVRYYIVFLVIKIKIGECSDPDIVCRAQSYVTTVSNLSSFFWMCVISFYFVIAIVNRDIATAEKMMVPSHVISWGLPGKLGVTR
jgi:G protein-coupled receptor 157